MKSKCDKSTLKRSTAKAALPILVLLVSLLGCPKRSGQFDTLFNQGVIPVSSDNPFVGSNLFLGREMEKSAYLHQFFRSTGAPQAIELTGEPDESPELKLFYAGRKEMYVCQLSYDKKLNVREWIVRGPYAVGRDYFHEVAKLPPDSSAVFEVYGTREFFGKEATPTRSVEMKPVFVPTPTPTRRPVVKRRPTIAAVAVTPSPPAAPSPMNFDQRSILESQQKQHQTPPPLAFPTQSAPKVEPPPPHSEAKAPPSEPHTAAPSTSHDVPEAHSSHAVSGGHETPPSKAPPVEEKSHDSAKTEEAHAPHGEEKAKEGSAHH